MAVIVPAGTINNAAIVVPDLYVEVVAPQPNALNGSPTNLVGLSGTASWGPVGIPVSCSGPADYTPQMGPIQNRKYDLGTAVTVMGQQGASFFKCVRVTDGTDLAASVALGTNFLTLTGKYTGSFGNSIQATWLAGSKAGTSKLVIAVAGQTPEVYDNLSGTGNALAIATAAAVNSGSGVARGSSNLIIATAGNGTTAPAVATTVTLAGGTDGVSAVAGSAITGVDVIPRKGCYALRNSGCSILLPVDCDDSTQWSNIAALALSEGMYAILAGPQGDTITNAVATKATAGLDNYSVKLQMGDWCWWQDEYNNLTRLVSPASFVAGWLANASPNQSSLNKQLLGIIGTQKSGAPGTPQQASYTALDIQTLLQAGIDVIANPCPGGSYYGNKGGINTSSNSAVNGDNYTRMTNFLAATFAATMGQFIGQVITDALINQARSIFLNTLKNLLGQGYLVQFVNGPLPYSVQCDNSYAKGTNNPISQMQLGYLFVNIQVQYGAILKNFIVNLAGGQTVTPNPAYSS